MGEILDSYYCKSCERKWTTGTGQNRVDTCIRCGKKGKFDGQVEENDEVMA